MANELLPPPAQPPRPQATASHVAASMTRGAVRKGVAARSRVAMTFFIAPSDIVKMC
jgi:hypothetical protein